MGAAPDHASQGYSLGNSLSLVVWGGSALSPGRITVAVVHAWEGA